MKTKSIKVAYSSQIRKGNDPIFRNTRTVIMPKIQIQGKWLEELGFHIGDRLTVEYGDGAIHIRPAEPEACMVCEPAPVYTASAPGTVKAHGNDGRRR